MSFSQEEFKRKLSGRIAAVTNNDPYPQLKGQLQQLGWTKSKKPNDSILEALEKLAIAADACQPRPSWSVLMAKIRQTGPDLQALRKLAKNPVDLISKPALDDVTEGHAFGRHFDPSDEQQLKRLLTEGKPQVTSISGDNDNTKRYMAYTMQVAKVIPAIARGHLRDTCLIAWAAVANSNPSFADLQNDGVRKNLVKTALGGNWRLSEDTELCSIDFVWGATINNAEVVVLTCAPEITSFEDFEKEIFSLNHDGGLAKRAVSEPVQAFFGAKKFQIGPFSSATEKTAINRMVDDIDLQIGFVTQY